LDEELFEKFRRIRELYLFREQDLVEITNYINLRTDNLETKSAKFYDFILTTSPLLEKSANVFFQYLKLPKSKGSFIGNESEFKKFMLESREHKEFKFNFANVEVSVKEKSFFDDDKLIIKPFDGLSKYNPMSFWKLYNHTKHDKDNIDTVIEESKLANALACLGSTYVFLKVISYSIIRENSDNMQKRDGFISGFSKTERFFGNDMEHREIILHESNNTLIYGPSNDFLLRNLGNIEVDSKIFDLFYWNYT